jgi:hypothetical protein
MSIERRFHLQRPHAPKDYGIPDSLDGTLPWKFVDDEMSAARNYWVATIHPTGRPHTMPTWGVWFDLQFFLEGSPDTRRFRNAAQNPNASVHLESGSKVVIMEGQIRAFGKPSPSLAERLAAAFTAKYAALDYQPTPDNWDQGGLYIFNPRKVLAWTQFPNDMTKWIIDQ